MSEFDRRIRLYADGVLMEPERIRISGKATMTLSPDAWTISLYNSDAGSVSKLSDAKEIVATNGNGGILCKGSPMDVMASTEGVTLVTRMMLISGLDFWRSTVSLSMQRGSSIRDTLCALIAHTGMTLTLGTCPASSGRIPFGQTFYGRTAGYVDRLAAMMGGRAFSFQGMLGIALPGDTAPTVSADEMTSDPEPWAGGFRVRTRMMGYPIGQTMMLGGTLYRIVGQEIAADTRHGDWDSYLLLVGDVDVGK